MIPKNPNMLNVWVFYFLIFAFKLKPYLYYFMFKLYRLITLVSIFFISSNSYAQKSSIDSLEILLKNPKLHDTTRLSIMSEIIGSSKIGDTTIGHYNKSIKQILDKRVKEKNLSKKELEAYKYSLAIWYCDKSAEISSKKNAKLIISYYDKAIAIFKELKLEDETWWFQVSIAIFWF